MYVCMIGILNFKKANIKTSLAKKVHSIVKKSSPRIVTCLHEAKQKNNAVLHVVHWIGVQEFRPRLMVLIFAGQGVHIEVAVFDVHSTAEGRQMSVVRRGRIGHGACASRKQMTQIVGHLFHLVIGEVKVVPQFVVLGGPGRTLDAGMANQIEI